MKTQDHPKKYLFLGSLFIQLLVQCCIISESVQGELAINKEENTGKSIELLTYFLFQGLVFVRHAL